VQNALQAYDQALADVDANARTEGAGLFGEGVGVALIIGCGGPQAATPACWGIVAFVGGSLAGTGWSRSCQIRTSVARVAKCEGRGSLGIA
jgi:hypothetical protein